ncbi:MAG: TRAP transporter small permease [Rhodobacteraceae bacterium]|jgi:TRAP-type C4-dicarboxylate transport system permease small subunit|nr:TRAP transporter small permease [Paracoccaceae bacterium]
MNDTQNTSTVEELASAFEEPPANIELGSYGIEDWINLAVFWSIVGLVFLQFFTRYALNNSIAWTEEVAVAALILLVFLGASMCIRTSRHIQVDVLYHYIPPTAALWLSRLVDLARVLLIGYLTLLIYRYISLVADEHMVSVRVSRAWVLYPVVGAFALMFLRSVQVAWRNWRRGYSVLQRPEAFDGTEV